MATNVLQQAYRSPSGSDRPLLAVCANCANLSPMGSKALGRATHRSCSWCLPGPRGRAGCPTCAARHRCGCAAGVMEASVPFASASSILFTCAGIESVTTPLQLLPLRKC